MSTSFAEQVHANAHAAVARHDSPYPSDPAQGSEGPPPARRVAEGHQYGDGEGHEDTAVAQGGGEGDTRRVAVKGRPPDKVGMALAAEGAVDDFEHRAQSARVGGV